MGARFLIQTKRQKRRINVNENFLWFIQLLQNKVVLTTVCVSQRFSQVEHKQKKYVSVSSLRSYSTTSLPSLRSYFDLMLLKFLPRDKCLMERFLDSHTSRADSSESRPGTRTIQDFHILSLFFPSSSFRLDFVKCGVEKFYLTVIREIQAGNVWDLSNATLEDLRTPRPQLKIKTREQDYEALLHFM